MRITGNENNILILKELGERIKDLRIAENMTQNDLADRSGVSVKTICRIEKGDNLSIMNYLNVLRALGILENLQLIVPEKRVSPEELHERGKKRERVSAKQKRQATRPFKWGDEL
jgi:transcriptional regulator with XRE-family HTH domain